MKRHMGAGALAFLLVLTACATASQETTTTLGAGATTSGAPGTSAEAISTTVATTAAPAADSTYSFGTVEPSSLDPALVADVYGAHVVRIVFDGLTDISPDLEVVPAVAESWERSDDVTWVFHLRNDVTFSNGRAVTAEDFVYAWNRAANPDLASPTAYHGLPIAGWGEVMDGAATEISGVRAIDDLTLEVTTNESFVLLPKVLAHSIFSPVPTEEAEGNAEFAELPIGNGPYQLASPWEHNVLIPLERNESYYGDPGTADRIDVKLYSDIEAAFRDVQGGNLDIAFQAVTPGLVSTAQAEFGDRLLAVPVGSTSFIQFPTQAEPYSNVDLRRALSLAIDREALADGIWSGTVEPAMGLVPPQANGAVADGCEWCQFDPERAAERYAQSGGLPDNAAKIYYDQGFSQDDMEFVSNGWRTHLGVETELVPMEFDPLLELMYAGITDGMVAIGWIWDYPSAYSFLAPLLESTSGDNTGLWVNETFDSLLAEARAAPDEDAAIPFLEEAQRVFGDEVPLAPLYFFTDQSVYSERLSNVIETAAGVIYLEDVEVVG